MDNGWQSSADAWVADMGTSGDFGRRYVLDPVMLPRAVAGSPKNALDVGCGEGRFCRMLKSRGVDAVGVDPTSALIAVARTRDPRGTYVEAIAERLPFREGTFDLVVSYLSLIDIPEFPRQLTLYSFELARKVKIRELFQNSRKTPTCPLGPGLRDCISFFNKLRYEKKSERGKKERERLRYTERGKKEKEKKQTKEPD